MTLDGGAEGPILVIDVGTSSVRAAVVTADAAVTHVHHRVTLPETPAPGSPEVPSAPEPPAAPALAGLDTGDAGGHG